MNSDLPNTNVKDCNVNNLSNTNNLKVIYSNVDQLPNKIDEICLFLSENDIDIMCVPRVQKNMPSSKS